MSHYPRPSPIQLLHLVQNDDMDAALAAGLMDYVAQAGDEQLDPANPQLPALLQHAQQRLRHAWDARARYRAREKRLARRAAERNARRSPPPAADSKPALPSAAALILARAKAKAAGNTTQ